MAVEQMRMPQLGESVTEGTISKWLVTPGDLVQKYEPIAEVTTDKVNAEIPSSFTGVIQELVAKEDETLAVGEVICLIEAEESSTNQHTAQVPETRESTILEMTPMKSRYSPAVLKLSQEHEIDLSKVKGSGKEGRITRKDLLALIQSKEAPVEAHVERTSIQQPTEVKSIRSEAEAKKLPSLQAGDIEIPVTGVRRTIATNMVRSTQEIPHAWMMVEVDATNLVKLRDSLKKDFLAKEGYPLTYFAFFVKAVAQALTEFPQINSMWAGDKIIQRKEINLSIAVATDDALFVPVIQHADEKTIKRIARDIYELAQKTRAGKLKQEELQGGTFTVNNTGAFGSIQSMGIINHPQAGILQIESIVKRPVIIEDMFAIRSMVNLCLSLDHRVLDGLIGGRFLARVKEIIEGMSKENTSIY
jgi:2-oxoisovalerate dehydrogenase E2 component (dihydrolipoyl transacylase)